MGKRILCILLAVLLSGVLCLGCTAQTQPYTVTYLDLFDTVTTILGTNGSEEDFQREARQIHDKLLQYHRLFDIYNEYENLSNLKTVNDQAGVAPVTVDPALIELLKDCKTYYELTDGKVNVAMGSVLGLWHEARQADVAKLPAEKELAEAAAHTDIACLRIDENASTVYLTDPVMSLDVGAVAKGWAVQKVAQTAPKGMLISAGGNVYATGAKDQDGTPWVVGVQHPVNSSENICKLSVTHGAVVTSGDYQRTYRVDGKDYHHIIDPATRMPSRYWRSVTVVAEDSALADALSTALFLLPLEEGKALAKACDAQVLWVDEQTKTHMTDGFQHLLYD